MNVDRMRRHLVRAASDVSVQHFDKHDPELEEKLRKAIKLFNEKMMLKYGDDEDLRGEILVNEDAQFQRVILTMRVW